MPGRRTGRIKQAARLLPQSLQEVDARVRRIGEIDRKLNAIIASRDERVAAINADATAEAAPFQEERSLLFHDVSAYAEVHRGELTQHGRRKTIQLPSGGELRWRTTPPKVTLSNVKKVLEQLKKLGLTQFIRIKEEVNKEAMAEQANRQLAATIAGVKIDQTEEFIVVPPEGPGLSGMVESA